MRKKTIKDYRLGKFRTLDILGKTKNPFGFLDRSDSKAIYKMVSDVIFNLKKVENENDKVRLQRFCFLLCEEIKSNFIELFQDKSTVKSFKQAISKKLSKELQLEKISNKAIFTENDILEILDKTLAQIEKEGIIEKYSNILSKKDTEKTIEKFSKEFFESNTTKSAFADMFKDPEKNSEKLTAYVGKLVASTATATKTKEKIEKLASELEAQQKPSSSSAQGKPSRANTEETPPEEKSYSFFGTLFKFTGLGIAAATAVRLTKMFDVKRINKNNEKKLNFSWKTAKTKMEFAFHKATFTMKKTLLSFVQSMKTFGEKSMGFIKNLMKFTFGGIYSLVTSPFKLLFSGIKKLFWQEEGTLKQKIFILLKRIIFSTGFFFFIGMVFGLVAKIITNGYSKYKEMLESFKESKYSDVDWYMESFENFKTKMTDTLDSFRNWITNKDNWINLGTNILHLFGSMSEGLSNTIQSVVELSTSIYDKTISFFNMPIVQKAFDMFKELGKMIRKVKSSPLGDWAMKIAGPILSSNFFSLIDKAIGLGISFLAVIIPDAFLKLFKGWNDEKERKAFRLEDEYANYLGGSTKKTEKILHSQLLAHDTPENRNLVDYILGHNLSFPEEINEYLGGEENDRSLFSVRQMLLEQKQTYRDLIEGDYLSKIFNLGFITNDTKMLVKLNKLSNDMFDYFMTNPNLVGKTLDETLKKQENFLASILGFKKAFFYMSEEFIQRLGLDTYANLIKDPYYIDKILDIFYNNYKNKIFFEGKDVGLKLKSQLDFKNYIYKKYLKSFESYQKRLIPINLHAIFEGSLITNTNMKVNGKNIDNNGFSWQMIGSIFSNENDFKINRSTNNGYLTYNNFKYADRMGAVFDDLTLDNFGTNKLKDSKNSNTKILDDTFNLDRLNGYQRMLYAISSPTREIQYLQNHPEELENMDWIQFKDKLFDGTLETARDNIEPESERFMFEILWKIFNAAKQ